LRVQVDVDLAAVASAEHVVRLRLEPLDSGDVHLRRGWSRGSPVQHRLTLDEAGRGSDSWTELPAGDWGIELAPLGLWTRASVRGGETTDVELSAESLARTALEFYDSSSGARVPAIDVQAMLVHGDRTCNVEARHDGEGVPQLVTAPGRLLLRSRDPRWLIVSEPIPLHPAEQVAIVELRACARVVLEVAVDDPGAFDAFCRETRVRDREGRSLELERRISRREGSGGTLQLAVPASAEVIVDTPRIAALAAERLEFDLEPGERVVRALGARE
jgi:hypothetical protein